jgi:hypothetical protein
VDRLKHGSYIANLGRRYRGPYIVSGNRGTA